MNKENMVKRVRESQERMIQELNKQIEDINLAAEIEIERINRGIDDVPWELRRVIDVRKKQAGHLDNPSAYMLMVSYMDHDFHLTKERWNGSKNSGMIQRKAHQGG